MGHGSAILLGFSFPVFTRVHLQHHIHVNHPKNDPDHIVSTFGPIWLIAPRFFYHEVFFFQRKLWRRYELLQWGIERALSFLPRLFDLSRDHFLTLSYARSSVIWLAINNKSLGISVPVRITSPDINRFSSVEIKSSLSIIFFSIAKKISSSMI